MSIFNQFPWVNFQNFNLDWCIRTVQDCKDTVDAALADVSNAVAMYFADHIDTTLSVSGDAADARTVGNRLTTLQNSIPAVDLTLSISNAAADAAVTGQRLTNLSSNVSTISGTVGGLTTSVLNLNTEVGKKADAIVIDADNGTYLKGGYAILHTLLEDDHKSVDVWVKSNNVYYKALKIKEGPDARVLVWFDIYYIGCDSDGTMTSVTASDDHVVIDFDTKTFITGSYSAIKKMLDDNRPLNILFRLVQNSGDVLCAARSIYQYTGGTSITVFFVDYLDTVRQVSINNNNVIS